MAAAAAAGGANKQLAAGSSSSSCRGRGDAASTSSSSRARASSSVQQQHHAWALGDRYELQSLVGEGSFAKVWEARHRRTGLKVAIKIISHAKMQMQTLSLSDANAKMKMMIAREIRVMRLLSRHGHGGHPHVIRFYESTSTDRHTYIVMELADAGQLWDHVVLQGRLPEAQARAIFRQLVAAVLFCHRNMVAHRDLKMENVLLATSTTAGAGANIKVVDFGFSEVYTDDGKPTMREKLGSLEYAAPELTIGEGCYVGPLVDVWSCGVILYGMLCGRLPFDGADESELARNVRRGEYKLPPWVSDDARDLVAGMLIVTPSKRATMADVMAHRWMQPADLAMPVPPPEAAAAAADMVVDEAAVHQLVTRHGFDRSSLLESLRRHGQQDDEAAVAYQLVLATISDAATRYHRLSSMLMLMRRPPEQPPRQRWALAGQQLDGAGLLLRDCPRLTMQRIAAALEDLRIPIVSYHTRRHRISCRADIHMNMSDMSVVFFEIQVYKTTTTTGVPPQYVVHLNRTSGPQLPYLTICSHLSSRLRLILTQQQQHLAAATTTTSITT